MTRKTTRFKQLVLAPEILMLPVAHDPLCARIAEKAGFNAICTAGYANSAALLAKPDVDLLTLSEMVDAAWRIVDTVDIPVFADGDTGHGNVTNVVRTVKQFEKAGVASLLIEDQVSPKRCGHMPGKDVIPADDMVAKLNAALDARQDQDFMITARTDAIAVNGIDDAVERANLYMDAGADMIFVEAVQDLDQMRRVIAGVDAPNLANIIPGGKTPMLTARELEEIGYAVVAYPTVNTYVIAKAATGLFTQLYKTGTLAGLEDRMFEFEEFNTLVGLP
ncbi:MAG: oxaloacetate decarboxylase, partial [Thermodesulfobacteriota bacterium]|nr:oxaloacetate decarboxylase [Thermodesulfobacteriota bacterium]